MDMLSQVNQQRLTEVRAYRDDMLKAGGAEAHPVLESYHLPALRARLVEKLSARWGKGTLTPQIDFIDRAKFGGDIALKFPQLLKDGGPKNFIANHVTWIREELEGEAFAGILKDIVVKGMYVNVTLDDRWLLGAAAEVAEKGAMFGLSNALAGRRAVIDYSSPNVAKRLHAGHIRSTIIGHVLANLLEAAGAATFRVNHINDFGGFGFMLEGYRRFAEQFPAEMGDNDKLLEIYRIRRVLETLAKPDADVAGADLADKELLARYFPGLRDQAAVAAAYADFDAASTARFEALENGDGDEVALWQKMVGWSLGDFEAFYQSLDIHIPLVMGESFYFQIANETIQKALEAGTAVKYTEALAEKDIAAIEADFAAEKFKEAERDKKIEAARKDIGAVVVPLDAGERYVVLRADGRSIYATRDIGCIRTRVEEFGADEFVYVVGQEQRVHFNRLFEAAEKLGLVDREKVRLQHLYFGFYVDSETGKKLSSRETVSNVTDLLETSQRYFENRFSDKDMPRAELEASAKQLSIGSLVFNDLKQDVKGSVEINSQSLEKTIEGFEKSGGAYVVYAACRARSILRRHGEAPHAVADITDISLDGQEAELILKIAQLPEMVVKAADSASPTTLIRHLYDIASIYNSYYMRAPVLENGQANQSRLVITDALTRALVNGLKLSHIECPERI